MFMQDIVDAAVEVARERGQRVSDVPVAAIAARAGMSRSTLLRRLGGSRAALDAAVRASGVDPGERTTVRERAIEATATLIGEVGLGAVTLDAVAREAGCSLPSLHVTFEGRDGLLTAVFERYGPIVELESLVKDEPRSLDDKVRGIYRALIAAFGREPRVFPALMGDVLTRPDGPASRLLTANFPRLLDSLGRLLDDEVRAGRLRPMPLPLLVQQLVGPLVAHLLFRPVIGPTLALPDLDDVCDTFAEAFLRATTISPHEE